MLYFSIQNRLQDGTSKVSKRRVRDDDFMLGLCSDYPRIILGMSSNRLSIGGSNSRSFR